MPIRAISHLKPIIFFILIFAAEVTAATKHQTESRDAIDNDDGVEIDVTKRFRYKHEILQDAFYPKRLPFDAPPSNITGTHWAFTRLRSFCAVSKTRIKHIRWE